MSVSLGKKHARMAEDLTENNVFLWNLQTCGPLDQIQFVETYNKVIFHCLRIKLGNLV